MTTTTMTMTDAAAAGEGASVDERDPLGYTALMMAVRCGNYAEAAVLSHEGQASTILRDDEYHRTAIEWAEQPSSFSNAESRTSRSCEHLTF